MQRVFVIFVSVIGILPGVSATAGLAYPIVGTGQTQCYDNHGEIAPPRPGEPFYGQDAQHPGPAPHYRDNGDGTVSDLNTGLMWVRARGAKVTWDAAIAGAAVCRAGGFSDWRMPSIKELYSLINFTGRCGGAAARMRPFIDTNYFEFVYGDESQGVRVIDCQDWSATQYVGTTMNGNPTVFGVNFADGRIKGYPKALPGGRNGMMYARYVRGNSEYGHNDFRDNRDGTITDRATGLMWLKADSGTGMNWEQALAYAARCRFAGHADWRLPNAKELQSIVDYTRAPAVTKSPAISPLFNITPLADGDYPFFWTSTTHLDGPPERQGDAAVYIAFGRATGWMGARMGEGPPGPRGPRPGGPERTAPFPNAPGGYRVLDVHGAGAQRSDPKAGNPHDFPHGRGPQGDVIRIYNFVRLVRSAPN